MFAGLDVQCDVHFRAAKKNEVDRPSCDASIQRLAWGKGSKSAGNCWTMETQQPRELQCFRLEEVIAPVVLTVCWDSGIASIAVITSEAARIKSCFATFETQDRSMPAILDPASSWCS